jgi:hypothetical protein
VTSYKISNLTNGTSLSLRRDLVAALAKVPGVNVVTLSPDIGEVSISFRRNDPIDRDILAAAMATTGFVLAGRSDRWTG